jgi:AcrR family transcriptional regulator
MSTASGPRRPDRKDQLATVAAELFRARGYHAVGVNDIAAAAGITGPALYRHFPDKQAILAHVLLDAIQDMETATSPALSTLDSPSRQRVEALLTAIATASVERRGVAALWRWEGRHLSARQRREIGRRSSAILTAWAKVLLTLRPQLAPADGELLCWAALSVFGSVSVHHTTVARARFVPLLVELAQRVLGAHLPVPPEDPRSAAPPSGVGAPTRREQLLTAAADLFHRHGFHGVSMEDIGAAAGIAGPSVYRHFPSKAAMLVAIARRAADRLALGAERALRTSANEAQALRRLVESYVQVLTGSAELAVAFSVDTANTPAEDRAELVRIQRDYVARWVGLLGVTQPQLNAREARITVHAALTIANDLARTRRIATRPYLAAELSTLMTATLGID